VLAHDAIEELRKRFKSDAARDLSATYLIHVKGEGGGAWLTCITEGECQFIPHEIESGTKFDCAISIDAEDLAMIMDGRMTAMTAALSGALAVDGELALAMKLVPIFFN
jgi:putative sterol carrier protein